MNPDVHTLKVIRKAAMALRAHINGYDQNSFEAERKVRSAVLYEIVIIGEGAKRLSAEFRASHPEVPWKKITGMRERVVHSFDEVNLGLVWNVSHDQVPSLIAALDEINARESYT
jgi:uncharacterized protein with HEPN domain